MNLKILKPFFALLIMIYSIVANAQPSEPGYPKALQYGLTHENLPVINLPYLNNEELILADTIGYNGKKRYGKIVNKNFDFWENCQFQLISNGLENIEVYRLKIKSPTAEGLHVLFERFVLDSHSIIYFYSPNDTLRILGAFSIHNNKSDSSFATNTIFNKEIIIEVNRRPISNTYKGILKINKFIHIYENRNEFGRSLGCHNNVVCNNWFNDWCNQIRGVVKFLMFEQNGDAFICSGSIINNTNNNFDPLILTANHCVTNGGNHQNWIFWFNFQSITCNPTSNGNDLMIATGTTLAAFDGSDNDADPKCPDMAILRLNEQIPLQYNVFFNGWNRRDWGSLPSDRDGTGIHHPQGDVKKISFGDIQNPLFNGCLKVDWTNGTTEPGSSGSPLFISTKDIVGVDSHGPQDKTCNNLKNTNYSWLNKSWGAMQGQLAPGSEALNQNGIDPISSCQTVINLNRRFFPGNDWQNRNQIIIQAAQQVNVANITQTSIEQSPFNNNPVFNSDYVIRAGNRITIFPRFKINAPDRIGSSGIYTNNFTFGNQNKVSFQIQPCVPFTDNCGFNHQNSFVVPTATTNKSNAKYKDFESVNLYPSPTSNLLNVDTKGIAGKNKLIITNSLGQVLYNSINNFEFNFTNTQINTSSYANGIYFLEIINAEGKVINIQKFSVLQ